MMADSPTNNRISSPPPRAEGTHVLLDVDGVKRLDDPIYLENILRRAADAAGAHIIGANFHHFGINQGVTGVLLLAESHISIHSWPEHDYAAIDLFLCGNIAGVDAAIDMLVTALQPTAIKEQRIMRGAPATA